MKIIIRSVSVNLRGHIFDMCVCILPLPKKSNSLVCIESILRIYWNIYHVVRSMQRRLTVYNHATFPRLSRVADKD